MIFVLIKINNMDGFLGHLGYNRHLDDASLDDAPL
jgi:hypothetical protein